MKHRPERAVRGAHRRVGFIVAIGFLTFATMTGSAEAKQWEKTFHYDFVGDPEVIEFCGIEVTTIFTNQGTFHIRAGKGKNAGTFFVHNNYDISETLTNDDGDFVTLEQNGLYKDVKATHVGGSIFEFVSSEQRLVTLRNSAGQTLLNEPGRYVQTYLFDTLGDDEPGGDFLVLLEERFSPPVQTEEDVFCGLVLAELG